MDISGLITVIKDVGFPIFVAVFLLAMIYSWLKPLIKLTTSIKELVDDINLLKDKVKDLENKINDLMLELKEMKK